MLFSVFTSLATATSAAAFSKHTSHPLLWTVGYAAVLTLIGVWLARGGLAWLHTRHRQRAVALSLALCAALSLANVVVYPTTRRPAARSSAPDALIDSGTRLVAGEYPYARPLFDSALISPGPGWIALHVPLTTAGLIWAIVPLHVALAALFISRLNASAAISFPLCLFILPAFLQMSLVGHDLFAVGCAMVTITLATYDAIAASVRARLVTSSRPLVTLALILCALAAAIVATARAPFAIVLPALGLLAFARDRRSGVLFTAIAGSALVAIHVGFYLWGQALGLYYHPFHVLGRAGGGAGRTAMAIGLLLSVTVAAWLWTRGIRTAGDWLLFIWATTGLPFVAVGFGELVNVNHMDWGNWEGKVYAGFSLPLLVAGLLLNRAQSCGDGRRMQTDPARHTLRLFILICVMSTTLSAQRAPIGDAIKGYVSVDAAVVALTNARVIDGTGAPARERQTIVIRDGVIAELGDAAGVTPPAGATVIDLAGKSVMPGLVMVHEHLYYPAGSGVYGQFGESFSRLYLAGGVTTMRTGGNMNGFMDFNLKRRIDAGDKAGPAMDATAPYLNGPNTFIQMAALKDAADARRQVAYWADAGATSFKAYMQISRADLGAAIDEAHTRKLKVTGHLCSVTYSEAADLGIDNLEHGFLAATDFVANKQPDVCPGQGQGQQSVNALDEQDPRFQALVKTLVANNVALTSTLTVFETFTPGRPAPPGLDVLAPHLRELFDQAMSRVAKSQDSIYRTLFPKAMALERAFARAGGTLVAGTDPTGAGGVVPGFSNQRQLELLVEAGFTPLEAIAIGTRNGARFLGRDARVGTLAQGKQADLIVINGDPSTTIADVRKVETVFKQGVGFDPAKLIESVRGRVGFW